MAADTLAPRRSGRPFPRDPDHRGAASGEHDHYIQLHCELRYEAVSQLRALGHFETWFFHDTDDELDAWADGLDRQEFWPIVRNFHPREIRVHQEHV
ncbi:hypothetical protein [Streptomyces sp. NPDC087859]|uniref:hypothetical protein n=1 Tax=Streptomyces sp. NPDC087859 TaxID=3365812 RepID=UPI00380924B0